MQILKRKVSIKDILRILSSKKKVEKIVCSQGTFNHLPKRAIKALSQMNVKIEVVKLKRGKSPVVDVGRIKELSSLPAYEIHKKTRIALRTVYYHLKEFKREKARSLQKTEA